MNRFGHVDLRVNDLEVAHAFYTAFLATVGMSHAMRDDEWDVFRGEGEWPSRPFVSLTEDPAHVPNGNRVAFWAPDRAGVDRAAEVLRAAGAEIESGPRACTEYDDTYYAVFFRDPSGNCLEVYHR